MMISNESKKQMRLPNTLSKLVFFVNSIHKYRFGLFVCALFSVVLAFGMYHHEMWRDEYEWFLFRKYNGIFDLNDPCYNFYNILCCLAIAIKPTLLSFKILHFLIILGAVAVVALLSPFSNVEKILISFGYFFVYEYGIITRPYSLVTLLVFLLSYEVCRPRRRYWLIGIIILLLAENNPLSLMISFGFIFYLSTDLLLKVKTGKLQFWKEKSLLTWICLFSVGCILLAVYYGIYLPKVSPIVQYKGGTPPLITMVNQIWNSYVPIPDLSQEVRFWWTNIFNFSICYPLGYIFGWKDMTMEFIIPFLSSIFILIVTIVKFSKNMLLSLTYIITTLMLGIFLQHFMKCYTIRYIGFLFITFLSCYWIFLAVPCTEAGMGYQLFPSIDRFYKKRIENSKWFGFFSGSFPFVLYFVLFSQVFAGLYALSKDYKYKFSHSEELAQYIKWNNYDKSHILVGYPDYTAECLGALIETKVYFPQTGCFSYHDDAYNPLRKKTLPMADVIRACVRFTEGEGKSVLLILNYPLMATSQQVLEGPAMLTSRTMIKLVKDFPEEVICGDEVYWLYELNPVH